ncbi:glycosyltransferase family 1 protein [Nocardia otitidiscaviarum]|uniref:glycosyltransferase n=1 Tax=Nocardia otitidiscaviarum TaxID=1823 RepID=UPI0018948765|nr:glycosyltransferase [Nocardia otitidiscaviarum]MBF6240922.1 glycosyltransferase family 1 protein [Nocardia otitidiscaviarum]
MRIALLTAGTRGDHQPYLALADELRTRGHRVEMTATENYADVVRRSGFEPHVIPFNSAELLESPAAKRGLSSGNPLPFVQIMRDTVKIMAGERGERMHRVLSDACASAEVIVSCASTLPWAMERRERTGQTVIGGLPYPLERTAEFPSSFMVKRMVSSRRLRLASYTAFEVAYGAAYHKMDRRVREMMGLPGKPRNPFRRIREDAIPLVHMVSPVLLPKPADWPDRSTIVGAPVLPARLRGAWGEARVDPELDAWLDEGEPPIYFCLTGMPILDPTGSCDLIAAVCRRLGARALVTVKGEGYPRGIGYDRRLLVLDSFDYDRVLPRCRAVVHHGGSGNTHDVLRAGLPAVVIGVHSDQFFYGWRISALGIGADFPYPKLTESRLYDALVRTLTPEARDRAAELGRLVSAENGISATADEVERLAVTASA